MKTIDNGKSKFSVHEVTELTQAEMITLVRSDTSLAIVMSHDDYKQIQALKEELPRSRADM